MEAHLAQVDPAKGCDTKVHTTVLVAMHRRGIPELLAMAYIYEARRACMTFEHAV